MPLSETLNNEDIKLLMEALDALKVSGINNSLFSSLIGIGLSQDKAAARIEAEREMEQAKKRAEEMEDRITLLKAKLIQMKDRNTIYSAVDFMKHPEIK